MYVNFSLRLETVGGFIIQEAAGVGGGSKIGTAHRPLGVSWWALGEGDSEARRVAISACKQ